MLEFRLASEAISYLRAYPRARVTYDARGVWVLHFEPKKAK